MSILLKDFSVVRVHWGGGWGEQMNKNFAISNIKGVFCKMQDYVSAKKANRGFTVTG